MRRGIALIAAGQINVAPLITHRFDLDHVDDAFRALQTNRKSGSADFKKAIDADRTMDRCSVSGEQCGSQQSLVR